MSDRRTRWLLGAVFVLQFLLFRAYVQREVAWTYPLYFDQAAYLAKAYELHDCMVATGIAPCARAALVGADAYRSATGLLLPLQSAALSLFFGASRLTALSTIFAYWILFQLTLFLVVRRLSRDPVAAWTALALLLSIRSPFLSAGGVADFRMDFVALCLLGVHGCLVAASGIFSDRRLSLASAAAAAMLLLFRYLTGVYLAGIWLCTALFLLFTLVRSAPGSPARSLTRRRLANMLLSGGVIALLAGPSIWTSRLAVYRYYFDPAIDHAFWAGSSGGPWSRLLEQAELAWVFHLGPAFLAAAALALAVALLGGRAGDAGEADPADGAGRVFFACCLLVPIAVLALYPARSISASGIVVPGVVAWVCLAASAASRWARGGGRHRLLRIAAAALACAVGIARQVQGYGSRLVPLEDRQAVRDAVAMYDAVGRYCERTGWRHPRLAVNVLRDDLANGGLPLTTLYYERHGVLLDVDPRLGASVTGVEPARLREALGETDVLLLAPGAAVGPHAHFPFAVDMRRLRPEIDAIVARSFVLLGRHSIGGEPLDVYVRPDVRVSGVSGDWVTSEGLSLSVPGGVRPGSTLVLRGLFPDPALAPDLASRLEVKGQLVEATGEVVPLETCLEVSAPRYELRVVLPPDLPRSAEWRVDLSFSDFFVAGGDTRQLVIGRPTDTSVLPPFAPAVAPTVDTLVYTP